MRAIAEAVGEAVSSFSYGNLGWLAPSDKTALLAHYLNTSGAYVTSDATTTRTTTTYAADWEGVYRAFGSGETAYEGGRLVRNYADDSDTIGNWQQAFLLNGSYDTLGWTINGGGAGYAYYRSVSSTFPAGSYVRISFNIDSNSTNGGCVIRVNQSNDGGAVQSHFVPAQLGRHSLILGPFSADEEVEFGMDNRSTFSGGDNNDGGSITVSNIQIENVTGQSNQNPGEYVPSSVGYRVFTTENGNRYANLFNHSQEFSSASAWDAGNATIADNNAVAPDGTTTAALITATNVLYGGLVRKDVANAPNLSATTTYTMSCYVKAGTHDYVGFRTGADGRSGNNYCYANLSTESVTLVTPGSGTFDGGGLTSVGNGWYRFWVVYTADSDGSAGTALDIAIVDSSGNAGWTPAGTETIYVWGAQLEEGSNLGDYVATSGSQSYQVAESTGATLSPPPSLLTHPAGTNLIEYSAEFDNAWWSLQQAGGTPTVTADQATSPDGTTNADLLDCNGATYGRLIKGIANPGAVTTITFSAFVKQLEGDRCYLRVYQGSEIYKAIFDPTDGSFVSESGTGSYGSESIGNGWYRVWITCSVAAAAYDIVFFPGEYAGATDNDRIYAWGAQLEESSYPSPPIPTSGATASINATAPVVSWPSGLVNDFVVKFDWTPLGGTNSSRIDREALFTVRPDASNLFHCYFENAGGNLLVISNTVATTELNRYLTLNISPGTEYGVSLVKTSSRMEIFADNSPSTAGTGSDTRDIVFDSDAEIGWRTGVTWPSFGLVSNIKIYAVPPDISDAEVLAL